MRRLALLLVILTSFAGMSLTGCARKALPRAERESPAPVARTGSTDDQRLGGGQEAGIYMPVNPNAAPPLTELTLASLPPVPAPQTTSQDQYNADLLQALAYMTDHKTAQALDSLKAAQQLEDTPEIRQQIERLQALMDQQAAAERTAASIQTVLDSGQAGEAIQLATQALKQYSGTDADAQLVQLKRQAEAWATAQQTSQNEQRARLCQEADTALQEGNLRAAGIAYEQALRIAADGDSQRRYDDVQAKLKNYDDCRERAATLRRDPANLEDALAALQEAAKSWDTLQVRQEMETCQLALEKRRDRLSVADFEVRGDLGLPQAGELIAEELLPNFKCRYDLVERSQLGRVLQELQLGAAELADNQSSRDAIVRLAKVRYLVLGSVSAWNGITVNARLVDARSGLIVQTAELVARSRDELRTILPQLANMLLMSDEQKMAYQAQLAQQQAVPPIQVVASWQPPPAPLPDQPPPPPLVLYSPRPPDLGGVQVAELAVVAPPAPVVVTQEDPVQQRLLRMSLEIGDNFFRRGLFQEAHRHFQLALTLSPHHADIELRVERCRPHLPPAPPVVVAPTPVPAVVVTAPPPAPAVVVVAPTSRRIAILPFVVNADPGIAPPQFGDWAAEQIAPYYTPTYDIVDRGEVAWYMGRLGLTMRDVVGNPSARCWLARALNVRFFVLGGIQQTASFDVTAHLVDSETGAHQSSARIHVKDHQELKLRMSELVAQTSTDAGSAQRARAEAQENERLLAEAKRLCQANQPDQATALCRDALKQHPGQIALQTMLASAEQQSAQAARERQRQQLAEQTKAQLAAAAAHQAEVARQAEAARARAAQLMAARTDADRQKQEAQRLQAQQDLVAQGRHAFQQADYQGAVKHFECALALKPTPDIEQKLATAREKAQQSAQARTAAIQAQQAAQKKQELAHQRTDVIAELQQHQADRQLQQARQGMAARVPTPQAVPSTDAHPRSNPAALSPANTQTATTRPVPSSPSPLLTPPRHEPVSSATHASNTPVNVPPSFHAAPAPQQAQGKMNQTLARQDDQKRAAQLRQLLTDARTALAAHQLGRAKQALATASTLAPNDPEVRQLQAQWNKERQNVAIGSTPATATKHFTSYDAAMQAGRQAFGQKHWDESTNALNEALRLKPGDAAATALLKLVQHARAQPSK